MTANSTSTNPNFVDDRSPICVPFILDCLQTRRPADAAKPFIIGLNGVQGVGKTTLVKALALTLREQQGLETLVVSIDDFYLTHEDQQKLAASQPDNMLVSCRGEPGTHDMKLALQFFDAICNRKPTQVPQYDKSAFSGQGDRAPESQWLSVNGPGQTKVQVVVFEGWCVGFRPLSPTEIAAKWNAPSRTLHCHKLEHLQFVNDRLLGYNAITDLFDAFIHIDAENLEYVYDWRLEQEAMLRQEKHTGMTDEAVVKFVDAYYPSYELFTAKLRQGLFGDKTGCQLRLVVGKDRKVKQKVVI